MDSIQRSTRNAKVLQDFKFFQLQQYFVTWEQFQNLLKADLLSCLYYQLHKLILSSTLSMHHQLDSWYFWSKMMKIRRSTSLSFSITAHIGLNNIQKNHSYLYELWFLWAIHKVSMNMFQYKVSYRIVVSSNACY